MRVLFWRRRKLPVLILHGMLGRRGALNITAYAPLIDAAFRAAGRGGHVVLDIDSPGGSPVQSDLLGARIRMRAEQNGATVTAVIGEVGASGGYWLACAADRILANPMSIAGSIGVVGGGFGFDEAIARLGVRRRLYTAGSNKARMDPFSPERPEDVDFVHGLLGDIHERFKAWVRSRRAGRLKGDEAALFDGSFMLGARALEAGLIDGLGDVEAVLREIGGDKARRRDFRPRRRGLLARLPRVAAGAMVDAVAEAGARRGPQL